MIVNSKENREQYIKRADDRVQLFFKSTHKFGFPVSVLNVDWNDKDVLGFVFAGPAPDPQAEDDAAWDEANLTTSEAQRKSGFEKIQRAWIEEVPWVYTFNAASLGAIKSEYGNYFPQPINGYGGIYISDRLFVK